jgi:exosortase
MPLILSFLGAHALRRRSVAYEEPSRWGFGLLIPALFLITIDSAIHTQILSAFALLLALPGLSLLLLGPQRTRALAFPFFLSLFMLPVPGAFLQRLHLFLRELTSQGSERVLHLVGIPAFVDGTTIHLAHGTLRVVEECSGFSALYAAVTVALVLAYLSRSRVRRVALLGVAFPLAIVCNVARVVTLAILAEARGYDVLETPIHVLSGYASFVLTLVFLFLFAERHPRRADG